MLDHVISLYSETAVMSVPVIDLEAAENDLDGLSPLDAA
jgi:hypothetical protein